MGRHGEPNHGNNRTSKPFRTLSAWDLATVTVVLVIIGITLVTRFLPPTTIAFGPWQMALFRGIPGIQPGGLMSVLAGLFSGLPASEAVASINRLTAFLMALACGLLAATTMSACRRWFSRPGTILAGCAAFGLVGTAPLTLYMGTAATPAALTLCLALGALLLFTEFWDLESNHIGLVAAGMLSGLAAVSHPSMGILIAVLMVASLFREGDGIRQALRPIAIAAGGLIGVAVPAGMAMAQGTAFTTLLRALLESPYPTLVPETPSWSIFPLLWEQLALLSIPAVAVLGALTRPRFRKPLLLFALLAACFGPLLPALTNDPGFAAPLFDGMALRLFVLFLVGLLSAIGLAWSFEWITIVPIRGMWIVQWGLVAIALLGLAHLSDRPELTRQHILAESVGKAMLADCASNGVLLVGEPGLYSLARTTQAVQQYRTDVRILPVEALWEPRWRDLLPAEDISDIEFPRLRPLDTDWSNWQHEQPVLLEQALDAMQDRRQDGRRGTSPFNELLLWDFIRDNSNYVPLYFAGLHQDWLMARVHKAGAVLGFPAESAASSAAFDVVTEQAEKFISEGLVDPAGFEAMTRLTISRTAAARKQNRFDEAGDYTRQAMQFTEATSSSGVFLEAEVLRQEARTSARKGDAQQAADLATERLVLLGQYTDPFAITEEIQTDLSIHEQAALFQRALEEREQHMPDDDEAVHRQELEEALWRHHEFRFLAETYHAQLETDPDDPELLYQYAAALTQMGQLETAWIVLIDALERAPTEVIQSVYDDRRFVLLRLTRNDD